MHLSIERGLAVRLLSAAALAWLLMAAVASADQAPDTAASQRALVQPFRTSAPPAIDGLLDDESWRGGAVPTGEWLSYDPLHGESIRQQTSVWVAYDADYLYFAFQCDDPDPAGIKTSITRRDNIWADDWVGISLDALGTGQLSYHLIVNPSGVQLDMLNSVAGDEDESPDFVWDSAGRRNDRGYAVEMRVPLQTIRFRGGGDVRMGILFWRRVSREGVSVSWPPLEPGKWVFEKHASMTFPDLRPRPPREVIPSTTYSRTQTRSSGGWDPIGDDGDVGVSAKYGVTSTITIDATVNPDFSQVESDAFQVEVNQRFPVFYSEKRPFFMEGAGIFKLAGQSGDNSMQSAIHTRRIIDPVFGAKVTGNAGRLTFGSLTAVDQQPGRSLEDGLPGAGNERTFNVLRGQYSLGPSNYFGALATDTEFDGGFNRVVGADMSWRVNATQRMTGFALASHTRAPHTPQSTTGVGGQVGYEYSTRRLVLVGFGEHYDREFEMQTAFINRVGLTSGSLFAEYSFYPDRKRYPWLLRIQPFSFTQGGRDRLAGGNELLEVFGVRLRFTRQGFLRLDRFEGFETWAGQRFDRGRWRVIGEVQLYRWLSLEGDYHDADAVFYDPDNPFQGHLREGRFEATLQPNGRLSHALTYRRVVFNRQSTGARVYDLDIVYNRLTYQFSRQFFIRGIAQYDSSRHQVLTDLLASYELRPGTVVYAGYGSLLEQRGVLDGEWALGTGRYQTTQRGLFFKASYLHRF
jgi:hypothetical protein